MWKKNRIPSLEEIDSHVFCEERAAEVYVLPTEGEDAQLIRKYVWDRGLICKESSSLRKLYRELGLSDTALARQEKVKVSITWYHPAPFSTDRYYISIEPNLEYSQNHGGYERYGGARRCGPGQGPIDHARTGRNEEALGIIRHRYRSVCACTSSYFSN